MGEQQYSDEELAYHEAGHAVAALLLGRTVTRVNIVRDDASRGVRVPSFRDDAEETPETTADKILILLAGGAAQHVRDPSMPRSEDAKDWPRAEALAGTTSTLETAWARAVSLLRSPTLMRAWSRLPCAATPSRLACCWSGIIQPSCVSACGW